MKVLSSARRSDHPNAPAPRTGLSYAIDAIAMPVYIAAIAYGSFLLGIPHPFIVAGVIAVGSLAIVNSRVIRRRTRRPETSTP